MKRLGGIWPRIHDFHNLYAAYWKARRGKSKRNDVAYFALDLETNLIGLQRQLANHAWRPQGYRQFPLYERKPRVISCAPFSDRVVHHALMNVIEPWLDRSMINQSYACRRGKGVHRALDYYQTQAVRHAYVLHLDVAAYFPSIPHCHLKTCIRRYLKDKYALEALDAVVDSAEGERGLPIGNLTSQILANLYLNGIDHDLQRCAQGYMRYVDDFFLFGDNKAALLDLRDFVRQSLLALGLRLHPLKQQLCRTKEKVDVLGFQLTGTKRWLRNDNGHRFCRRLRRMQEAYRDGRGELSDFKPGIMSWIGHAQHGATWGLRKKIFSEAKFSRAVAE